MARISTYAIDTDVTKDDKVIGTDASGLVTKNFKLSDIASVANKELTVAGQLVYQLRSSISPGAITQVADGSSFSSVTSLRISELDYSGDNVENFVLEFKKKRILIVDIDDKDKYGIYDVSDIVEDSANAGNIILSLEYHNGNGNFTMDNFYIFALYAQESTYRHSQTAASASWDVYHNMNKYPSVSVTLSSGNQGIADITYVNKNYLTVSFSAAKSGYAYLN